MPLSNQRNMNFTLDPFDEDKYDEEDAEDERFNGLLVRRSTSYSMTKKKLNSPTKLSARQSSDTIAVDQAVACALKSRPRLFQYTQKHLQHVSSSIACLAICENLRELDLSGNELQSLPKEIERLRFIETCNLGKNHFSDVPLVLGSLPQLTKLLLFHNHLADLSRSVTFSKLTHLRVLNLNHNSITQLPASIGQMIHLEIFTAEHNQLRELPREIGSCRQLIELQLGFNQLTKLPLEIGYLTELKRFILHRNKLLELPESICNLKTALKTLDVACNSLRIFPSKFHTLQLSEFYAEGNPLLERVPIHSIQESEILTLKEICARRAMNELRRPTLNLQPTLRERLPYAKRAKDILMQCTECQFCHNYFLNTWLECVEFIDLQRTFKGMKKNNTNQSLAMVPQRSLLCSYECFNSPGHSYFGVAFA